MARHFPSRDGRGSVVFCKRGEVCLDLLNDLFLREGTLSLHLLCGFCRPGVVRRIYFFFALHGLVAFSLPNVSTSHVEM